MPNNLIHSVLHNDNVTWKVIYFRVYYDQSYFGDFFLNNNEILLHIILLYDKLFLFSMFDDTFSCIKNALIINFDKSLLYQIESKFYLLKVKIKNSQYFLK